MINQKGVSKKKNNHFDLIVDGPNRASAVIINERAVTAATDLHTETLNLSQNQMKSIKVTNED